MHYYACPYCPSCEEAKLVESTMEEIECKYDKEDICEERHKCKDTLTCEKCKEIFTVTKKFLKEQKKKIKDG